jgi:hypothetical protein
VVIAVAAGLAVDGRLDRHWILRGLTLFLAVCCAALLLTDQARRLRQIVTVVGLVMFGLITLARLRSRQDGADLRADRRGESQAAVSGQDLQQVGARQHAVQSGNLDRCGEIWIGLTRTQSPTAV